MLGTTFTVRRAPGNLHYNFMQLLRFEKEDAAGGGLLARVSLKGTVSRKSHDPCFHKKYTEAGVMTFVAHCTDITCYPLLKRDDNADIIPQKTRQKRKH